jgi:hypothetical protein
VTGCFAFWGWVYGLEFRESLGLMV